MSVKNALKHYYLWLSVSPAHFHMCTAAACNAMAGDRTDLLELFSAHRGITSDKITERKVMPRLARERVESIIGHEGGVH